MHVMTEPRVVNLTPINIIYASDGTSLARYQYNISNQTITRLSSQNLQSAHIALVSDPTQLISVSATAPAQATIYHTSANIFTVAGSATLASATLDMFVASHSRLYWIQGATIFGAQLLH